MYGRQVPVQWGPSLTRTEGPRAGALTGEGPGLGSYTGTPLWTYRMTLGATGIPLFEDNVILDFSQFTSSTKSTLHHHFQQVKPHINNRMCRSVVDLRCKILDTTPAQISSFSCIWEAGGDLAKW